MAADPRTGKVLQGRYKIAEPLAEGGMGVVYRAERVGIGRPVVVKFLHTVLTDTPGIVDRFEREARATALLNHPNCVGLVDYGLEDGSPYLVMEFVEGKTLADLLDHGPLPPARAVNIARQVLAGLSHAHTRGILHRDLKPANIMIIDVTGFTDFVKILDFGLAKLLGPELSGKRDVTVQGIAIGTPGYMSPEQAAGVPSDRRADIYCTGALLYHLVTGQKAFEGDDIHSVLRRHREETPAMPRKMSPSAGISKALEDAITRAMQREPSKRYQTAEEMMNALGETPEGRRSAGERAQKPRPPDRPISSSDDKTRAETGRSRKRERVGRPSGAVWVFLGMMLGAAGLGATLVYTPIGEQLLAKRRPRVTVPPVVPPVIAAKPAPPPAPVPIPVPPEKTDKTLAEPQVAVAPQPPPDDPLIDDDGSNDDDTHPPAEVAPAPTRESLPQVKTIADAKALLKKGDNEAALAGLYRMRRSKPTPTGTRAAEIAVLVGHIYFDKQWWSDALKEYLYALKQDGRAKTSVTLVNNTVRTLGARGAPAARARKLIRERLGRTAIPALRAASKNGASPELRRNAQDMLQELEGRSGRRAKR